ncbi:MAG: nucleoside hydrolase [Planctomycetota bacterium]
MPQLDPSFILSRLQWPMRETGPVDVVIDTDTFNEIDDQFALVYAMLSTERMRVQAVYAAPFENRRSTGPTDGMEKSYEEITRVLKTLGVPERGWVFRGSTAWLPDVLTPVASEARDDLIERARQQSEDRPLYVVAIGAPTNVASALIAAPDIRKNIVVLWLGGHPLHWHTAREFNLAQDPHASGALFDSGVPLVLFPCRFVAEMISCSLAELDTHLAGRCPIGNYLTSIFRDYDDGSLQRPGRSKEIWDLAPLAWLMDNAWVDSAVEPSPILTDRLTWSRDARRHPIRVAQHIKRDPLFADFFSKCAATK